MVLRLASVAALCAGAGAASPPQQYPVLPPPSETLRLQYEGPVHILVTSVGGVGTTTMLEELSYVRDYNGVPLKVNKLDDKDGLKHTPFRRLQTEHSSDLFALEKILYLWGNPRHAVESLYKRGYATTQAEKLHQYAINDRIGFENRFPHSIWGYAKRQKEVFEFEAHYDGFRAQKQYTIAFLHMEAKTSNLVDLGFFLGCNPSELEYHLSPWQEAAEFELATLNELANKFPNTTITEEMLANHTRYRVAMAKDAKRRALHEAKEAQATQATSTRTQAMPQELKFLAPSGDEDDYDLSDEIRAEIDGKFKSLNYKTSQIGDWNLIMNEGEGDKATGRQSANQNQNQNQNQYQNQNRNQNQNQKQQSWKNQNQKSGGDRGSEEGHHGDEGTTRV